MDDRDLKEEISNIQQKINKIIEKDDPADKDEFITLNHHLDEIILKWMKRNLNK